MKQTEAMSSERLFFQFLNITHYPRQEIGKKFWASKMTRRLGLRR